MEQLVVANCASLMPALSDLRNPDAARRVRNRLLEDEVSTVLCVFISVVIRIKHYMALLLINKKVL